MVITDKDLQSLANFMGYGDPNSAQVFFMGIEEHDTFADLNFVSSGKYAVRPNPSDSSARGATERMQCHIYRKLVADAEERAIFESGIHCFNYYPVGARNVAVLPTGLEKYGSKAKLYDYIEKETLRLDYLRAFIQEKILAPRKLLFVLGKRLHAKAMQLLPDVKFTEPFIDWTAKGGKPSPIQWSEDRQVWLTGHPSYGWITNEVVARIARLRGGKGLA